MLLEVLYKVVANLLKNRLTPIQESLEQESQCGFRPNRGCTDASFSLGMAVKRRREHGMETWVLLLDLVKAFDRVPRSLLWKVLRRFGVPEKLVSLLKALHAKVNVKFAVEDVEVIIQSIIGVKQGDILGPQLFLFLICAIMQSWRTLAEHDDNHKYALPVFRTKMDAVVGGRKWSTGGQGFTGKGCSEFRMSDSEYADDTGLVFCSREDVVRMAPKVNAHFARWGMEVHEKRPGDKKVKTARWCSSAPPRPRSTTTRKPSSDGADLSDIVLPNGNVIPVVRGRG